MRGSWHCKCARLLHDIQLSEIPNHLKECMTIALLPKDIRLQKKVQDVLNRQIVEVARAVWEGGGGWARGDPGVPITTFVSRFR